MSVSPSCWFSGPPQSFQCCPPSGLPQVHMSLLPAFCSSAFVGFRLIHTPVSTSPLPDNDKNHCHYLTARPAARRQLTLFHRSVRGADRICHQFTFVCARESLQFGASLCHVCHCWVCADCVLNCARTWDGKSLSIQLWNLGGGRGRSTSLLKTWFIRWKLF